MVDSRTGMAQDKKLCIIDQCGNSCCCSTYIPFFIWQVALKIQFLRLIHSFCDHSDYKHLLMSKIEWDELNRIPSSPTPAVLRWLPNAHYFAGSCSACGCYGRTGMMNRPVGELSFTHNRFCKRSIAAGFHSQKKNLLSHP